MARQWLGNFDSVRSTDVNDLNLNLNAMPAMTATSAALISACYTLLYVVPFYLSSSTRPSKTLSSVSDAVIKARIRLVTISCFTSALITVYVLNQHYQMSSLLTLHLLGVWPVSLLAVLRTTLLMCILFVGPLFKAAVVEQYFAEWISGEAFQETFSTWNGWRTLIAAPISEEVLFRSCMIPLHILAHVSPMRIIFLTPVYFGIAHVHHFYEFRINHPKVPLLLAILRSIFQFTYTSVFGFFAAFLYLRTGSLPSVILAHMFCNWMGFPQVSGKVLGPSHEGEYQDWTIMYYLLLVLGAIGFYFTLWPLTECGNNLINF